MNFYATKADFLPKYDSPVFPKHVCDQDDTIVDGLSLYSRQLLQSAFLNSKS